MKSTDDILKKYRAKIENQMRSYNSDSLPKYSQSYEKFREEMSPEFTRYEKWCKTLGGFFKIKVVEKDNKRISRAVEIAHLNVTPSEVVVLSTVLLILTLFGGALFFTAIWLITDVFSFVFLFLVLVLAVFLFFYFSKAPERLAMKWRLKASSQMVPAILYIVIYMKHTSNFEKAISFAAEHLQPPLSLDFKKIFWDVEIGRFSTLKESLDNYLLEWRDYSMEFIEALHLVESSLYEPDEARRVNILEKSLQVVLDGVYDKMLKYTHEVRSPLTNVYMLGIVLPTLALAILPLASTMMGGSIKWYHLFIIFNFLIPFVVLYLTESVLMKRPGGYGEANLLEKNPLYPQYKSNRPYFVGFLLGLPFLLIGLIPLFLRYTNLPFWLGLARDYTWKEVGMGFMGSSGIFGIVGPEGVLYGPSGVLSLILSLFVPISISVMFIVAFKMKTKELIKASEEYKNVEKEFTSSLFQLGNRLGDGLPAEIAFSKISESTKGTSTEGFFKIVNENIQQIGMSLEKALFDPKRGAVIFYPSQIIATSMKILIESVKKGLNVAARSLMSISDYIKNIRKINDRLNDLLSEIISDMKSNMTFLAPLLSGIILGLSGMISTILNSISAMFDSGVTGSEEMLGSEGIGGLLGFFDPVQMIPTYWLQIVIGLYLIEIVFILSSTLVTIKSGRDKLQTTSETGKNLKRTITLYFIVALSSIIGLSLIGAFVLSGLT